MADRCTCQPGRASDGSERGPCAYCEDMAWRSENGMHDEDLEAILEGRVGLVEEEDLWGGPPVVALSDWKAVA